MQWQGVLRMRWTRVRTLQLLEGSAELLNGGISLPVPCRRGVCGEITARVTCFSDVSSFTSSKAVLQFEYLTATSKR